MKIDMLIEMSMIHFKGQMSPFFEPHFLSSKDSSFTKEQFLKVWSPYFQPMQSRSPCHLLICQEGNPPRWSEAPPLGGRKCSLSLEVRHVINVSQYRRWCRSSPREIKGAAPGHGSTGSSVSRQNSLFSEELVVLDSLQWMLRSTSNFQELFLGSCTI